VSFTQVSPPKPCTRLSSPPYALHASPVSFFSILSPEQLEISPYNLHRYLSICLGHVQQQQTTSTPVPTARFTQTLTVYPSCPTEMLHPGDLSSSMESLAYDTSVASPGNGQQQRTKRMRTSFKHHQLRTMKSYFAINQNPDAKDLKQLAQKTGLSKRVLQVSSGRSPGHRSGGFFSGLSPKTSGLEPEVILMDL